MYIYCTYISNRCIIKTKAYIIALELSLYTQAPSDLQLLITYLVTMYTVYCILKNTVFVKIYSSLLYYLCEHLGF